MDVGTPQADVNRGPDRGFREDIAHLIQNLDDGLILFDTAWRITYANDAARRISRIADDYLNGLTHWELYPATLGTELERVYRRSMEQRLSLKHEFYYAPFEIWIELQTLPVPGGLAAHYRTISRLKQVEADNRETAQRLQQVFDLTNDGVVVYDRNFTITFLNRRAREVLAPSGEVVGRTMAEAFPYTQYEGSPFIEIYGRTMRDGTPGHFVAYYPEPINLWLSIESRRADDGIIVFFRDITEERMGAEDLRRKTAEVQRQAAEIETVFRTAPIGLALFDIDEFRYQRLNDRQAAFFGLKPEQIVGQTLTDMAPIPGLRELFEQVKAGTPVVNFPLEGELSSHPGEHRYWTVNYFPVHAPDGSILGIAAASLEVTAQKKAEKALIESEKLAAVGRLASSISHEINNPLESITNLLYLIAGSELTTEVRTYVDLAQSEIARVSQIATQTLRFHRQASHPLRVTGRQLVEPVLTLYQGRLNNSGITVKTDFTATQPVLCLENEIRQVLNNLIANAIDAMRHGGTLKLSARDAVNATGVAGVEVLVEDTGHGMPETVRARIFEPFFTTKDINGTGLGLWISAEIVERHHGELTARSSEDAASHGTEFQLFLPLI